MPSNREWSSVSGCLFKIHPVGTTYFTIILLELHLLMYFPFITRLATQTSPNESNKCLLCMGTNSPPLSAFCLSLTPSDFLLLSFPPAVRVVTLLIQPTVLPCSKHYPILAEGRLPFLWPPNLQLAPTTSQTENYTLLFQ